MFGNEIPFEPKLLGMDNIGKDDASLTMVMKGDVTWKERQKESQDKKDPFDFGVL